MTTWTPKPGLTFGCSRIGDQAPVLAAVTGLAQRHPDLPSAYLTLSYITPGTVSVQLASPQELTAWRDALAPDAPIRGNDGDRLWADFTITDVAWELYCVHHPSGGEAPC
ncbi:hypothetical protein POF50_021420 [Streptomyces sp. SL13]|uniref:Uncharacterized protein n=1 Tax=Streptantibioticus silvisoli TaxID=2705255 RepID=A0AA90JZ89_9ACTN|nr:hypothetical protein [Streptantibioticus silvisoli]MDI5971861.1 hypothetical protein [Streptantibioticus silvisoli]